MNNNITSANTEQAWINIITDWSKEFNLNLPETYNELMSLEGIVTNTSKQKFARDRLTMLGESLRNYIFPNTKKLQNYQKK